MNPELPNNSRGSLYINSSSCLSCASTVFFGADVAFLTIKSAVLTAGPQEAAILVSTSPRDEPLPSLFLGTT